MKVCASCGRGHGKVTTDVHTFGDLRIRLCSECVVDKFRVGKACADARGEKWDPASIGEPIR